MSLTIGVDVGGTKVAGGLVDEHGTVLAQHRVDTPARDAEATTTAIVSVIEAMRAEHEVEAVGIGIAGFVDAARSKSSTSRPTCSAGATGRCARRSRSGSVCGSSSRTTRTPRPGARPGSAPGARNASSSA